MSAFNDNDDEFDESDVDYRKQFDKHNKTRHGGADDKDGGDDDDGADDVDDDDGSVTKKNDESDNDTDTDIDSDDDEDNVGKKVFANADNDNDNDNELFAQNIGQVDINDENDDDEDDEEDENYLQKFDEETKQNIIGNFHPELHIHNYDEVDALSRIVRNELGAIIDPLHKTLPFLTKYEKARILGERAKQLNAGAVPFIKVDPTVIDGYLIALAELEQKKIPFIVKRPMPNGGCEYWKLKDLEFLI
jgi:DNA-directed RNA polymerase I, II, and III subunit RPABC2